MSSKFRFIGVLSVALGMAALSTAASAQDDKGQTATPNTTTKTQKHGDRQFGQGRVGKGQNGEFGGPRGHRMGKGGHGGMRGGMMGGFHGITLTDAQKEQIKSIREANKPDKSTMEELRTIMQARKAGSLTDAQKARAKELRQSAGTKAKSVHEQILNVLTAEQKAQIQKNREEMKQRREEMKTRFENRRKDRQNKTTTATPPVKKDGN